MTTRDDLVIGPPAGGRMRAPPLLSINTVRADDKTLYPKHSLSGRPSPGYLTTGSSIQNVEP